MSALADDERPACTGKGRLFFSLEPEELKEAREMCRTCPYRLRCLDKGLSLKEKWGMYGGVLLYLGKIPKVYTKRYNGAPKHGRKPDQIKVDLRLVPQERRELLVDEPPPQFRKRINA